MGYQPGLDGLRAISVIAVIFYHAGFGWMHGGFFGVEVFFVVSGYLITTLLIEEHERAGRVDLRAFWARRIRRLGLARQPGRRGRGEERAGARLHSLGPFLPDFFSPMPPPADPAAGSMSGAVRTEGGKAFS